MAIIIGNNSNNTLSGTASLDTIVGRAGNDQLFGNGGTDLLNGGTQNDLLNGGTGMDTADYSNLVIGGITYIGATAGVSVNLGLAGAQNTGGAGTDTLVSIENLIGTRFNDTLTGNAGNNVLDGIAGNDTLTGGSGNDQLYGRSGHDQLFGGNGNDLLTGGSGNDLLNGGTGIDTASYSTASAGVTVDLDLLGAQNTGGGGTDTLVSIEHLTGSNFNDTLTGAVFAKNTLDGGAGNDILAAGQLGGEYVLNGGTGNDILYGSDGGHDLLNGGDGNDILYGVRVGGDNVLNGGAGDDTLYGAEDGLNLLTGGTGADTMYASHNVIEFGDIDIFDYNSVSDSPAGAGRDVIHQFNGFADLGNDYDLIDLATIDANTLVSGNQAFIFGGSFTAGHLRYVGGVLQGNTDGDAAPELEIQLVGAPTLTVGGADNNILL